MKSFTWKRKFMQSRVKIDAMGRIKTFAGLFVLCSVMGLGQKTPFPNPNIQLLTNAGTICAACKLYTYVAGGTTPVATYTSATGGGTNTNPVTLDSAGRANVWTTPGVSYRFDLYDASAVLVWSVDNIPGGTLAGASTVTANYVFSGPTTGAAATPTFRALVSADIPNNAANTSGNAATATALASNPTDCSTGLQFAIAIAASGNLTCTPLPSYVYVAGDFTTSGSGTALETITGLTWTIPASTALNVAFLCNLTYSQAVANDAVAFGIQDVTVSPTNIAGRGVVYTSTTASTEGNLATLTTTTATAIVSATPGATATNYVATVSGFIEAPSNASTSLIRIMVSTATAADLVTVKRGSFCKLS